MSKKLLQAAAGNAGEALYVEDVFSTYLYTGNGSTQTITNGIDLAGEGGLVWCKDRGTPSTTSANHGFFDTERGTNSLIYSNLTIAAETSRQYITFNSDGFDASDSGLLFNGSGQNYASWTFRKAPKFFDVVTYTGDGADGRAIAHDLETTPHFLIVKQTNGSTNWWCLHYDGATWRRLNLNSTAAASTPSGAVFGDAGGFIAPNETTFTVGDFSETNASGGTYVAYLFASDAGGFGDDDESIIKCGSAAATGLTTVDCGFEPQWVLIKSATVSNSWYIFDSMRGLHATGVGPQTLNPNLSSAEYTESADTCNLTSTGFTFNSARFNGNATYIYIAIRRPMKTPESGTAVFAVDNRNGTTPAYISDFPVDWVIRQSTNGGTNYAVTRMTGTGYLNPQSTNAEASSVYNTFDFMDGFGSFTGTYLDQYAWMFKRATGFFDVVAYTGSSQDTVVLDSISWKQQPHNLGVAPEFIIVKSRSTTYNWWVFHKDLPDYNTQNRYVAQLNSTNAAVVSSIFGGDSTSSSEPNANYWYMPAGSQVNLSGQTFIAYLFATVAGVSKVGSYTGTGSNVDVDCGFSAGARFILIKRTDSTGDWYVWDSERGIVAGNDPYLLLNSTAAEVTSTDYIDPLSSGFTVTSSAPAALNASGGTYIYLAIS